MLKATEDFSQMDESYVIFITEKDVIGCDQAIYSVNRYFEDTKELGNGLFKTFLNGSAGFLLSATVYLVFALTTPEN